MDDKIKNIFFDLDDTLIPSEKIYELAYQEVGIDQNGPLFLEAKDKLKKNLKQHTSAHHRLLYFKNYLEIKNDFSSEKLLSLMNQYEKSLTHYAKKYWQELNRKDFLIPLAKNYKLGIITNETTRTQLLKLSAIDPHSKNFTWIITSEEIGVEKPDKKIFLEALSKANSLAQNCLMVGDHFQNDIQPAKELGFHTAWVEEFNPNKSPHSLSRLAEIAIILER